MKFSRKWKVPEWPKMLLRTTLSWMLSPHKSSLAATLFKEGVERGFYARVSRLGAQWLELDLHFLSLGGGEIALGWWFEECLVPYLSNTSKLESVQTISIVTGYGKTRSRGARLNDDGMRLRVRAMLKYMNTQEAPQPNKGRIHIEALIDEVRRNNGKIRFDIEAYVRFKEEETTSNKFPDDHNKFDRDSDQHVQERGRRVHSFVTATRLLRTMATTRRETPQGTL